MENLKKISKGFAEKGLEVFYEYIDRQIIESNLQDKKEEIFSHIYDFLNQGDFK